MTHRIIRGVFFGALLSFSGAAGGCSHGFTNCTETLTCPRSGGSAAGGELSVAGSGGLSPGQETGGRPSGGAAGSDQNLAGGQNSTGAAGTSTMLCSTASDCDDHQLCNGSETCVDGTCRSGTPPCVTQDTIHCVATCDEKSGAHCGVAAIDADQDGHGSNLCAAAPGDDCDDTQKSVFPGATELCDGLDNDCDTLTDFAEGFAWNGTDVSLSKNSASTQGVAWLPGTKEYGAAWKDATGSFISFLTPTGIIKTTLPNPAPQFSVLAGGENAVGLFSAGASAATLKSLNSSGTVGINAALAISALGGVGNQLPQLAQNGNSEWFVAYQLVAGDVFGQRISDAGGLLGGASPLFGNGETPMGISQLGTGFLLAHQLTLNRGVQWRLLNANLSATGAGDLDPGATNIRGVAVGRGSTSSTVAWIVEPNGVLAASVLKIARISASGSVLCGPQQVALANIFPQQKIAEATLGFVSAEVNGYTTIGVAMTFSMAPNFESYVFGAAPNCELSPPPQLLQKTKFSLPFQDGGSSGQVVGWTIDSEAKVRIYGPHLCDAPTN